MNQDDTYRKLMKTATFREVSNAIEADLDPRGWYKRTSNLDVDGWKAFVVQVSVFPLVIYYGNKVAKKYHWTMTEVLKEAWAESRREAEDWKNFKNKNKNHEDSDFS